MHIDDFNGRTTVDDAAGLVVRLSTVRRGPYGTFILSHNDDGPSLWVHVNRGVAYLHYFPEKAAVHPGFQPIGMTPSNCEEEVHFIQTNGDESASFDMWRGSLVPAAAAYNAACEFLAAPERPVCINWTEL